MSAQSDSAKFVLWLNGFSEAVGETPTPEQWARVKEEMQSMVGKLASAKIIEMSQPAQDVDPFASIKYGQAIRKSNFDIQAELEKYRVSAEASRKMMRDKLVGTSVNAVIHDDQMDSLTYMAKSP